jgi:hypothetical protein
LAFTAAPQVISFAQSDPFDGTWRLNLAKSEFNFGWPPKALTINVKGEGQNRKATVVGFDAAGNPLTWVFMFIHGSQPHPVTGAPFEDAMVDEGRTSRADWLRHGVPRRQDIYGDVGRL